MQIAIRHNLQIYDPADSSLREDTAIVLPIRDAQAVTGETVAVYLDRVAWHFDLPTICLINGECYGRAEWSGRALMVNDNVEFVSRPLGSGSGGSTIKSIASVVALIALTAVAGPAGTAIGGSFATAGTFAASAIASIASAAIVGAGALAISYFLSPKAGGKSASTDALYSFGFQGNQARPMQPIPVLNGRLRFAPDYAAPTYSEYDGDAMTDYALFAITCGRWRPEQVLLGDTPIWHYQTGYNADYPGIELQFVEPGEQVTLYPVNVVTADELSGFELTTTWSPGYVVNAAGTQAKELLLDFVWPGGAYHTGEKGKILRADTHIVVRIRPVDNAGAPEGGWIEFFGKVYSNRKQSQIRVTERLAVPSDRWEVSVKRFNEPTASDNGTDAVTWTALRAHIDGPQSFPRVSVLAVKGVASKQLSGISGGQLRVIGTRILPVWRDGQFVEEPTRSIAWAALDWWRNGDYAAGLSLSDTDFQAFVAYDALWASLGHSFDHRFTEVQNLDDVLETVLKAGRAFPAPVGDKLTITRDQPRGLSRMLFTENDIVRDSLEIDYALSNEAWADGMVGEYVDQSTWRLSEVSSAPDGVQLLKPARVQLEGVVDRKQAAGMIRFMAAESQYRRITVSWTARMEGRLLKRGDLVKITAEEPETWGESCEIAATANNGLTLTLDPAPVWEPSGNHYIEVRRRDGRPWGPVRVTRGAAANIAIVDGADATAVAGQQGMTLADAVARSDTQERPWLAFSPGQPRTFPVLITEGDPDQDGEHIRLTGVIDAAEVYTTTEDGVPPLLQIPDLFSSALPAIIGLVASISQRQLVLILTAGWQAAKNAVSYVAEVSYDEGREWVRAYEGDRTTFEAVVGAAAGMRVRVAGVTPAGVRGAWYVVQVEAPDIAVDGDVFKDLSIQIEKLSAEGQQVIRSINDLGRGLLTLDQATGNVGIDLAHDTILGGLRQLQRAYENLAEAQATETTNAHLARGVIKVGTKANFAAIERIDELRLSDKEAFVQTTTNLAAQLTLARGDIVANAGIVQGLSAFVNSVDGRVTSQAQDITAVRAEIDATNANVSGNATATQALTTRVTLTEGNILSVSQAVTALQSGLADQAGQSIANAQATNALTTTVSNLNGAVGAQATLLQALRSTVGGYDAILTTYGASIDGVKVQFGVTGEIDGQTGGFVFTGVRRLDGVVSYSFLIRGDAFVDGTLTARALAAENIIVKSAQIGDLIVGTRSIADRAVTNGVGAVSDTHQCDVVITTRQYAQVFILAIAINGNNTEFPADRAGNDLQMVVDDSKYLITIPNPNFTTGTGDSRRRRILSTTLMAFDSPTPGQHKYTAVNSAGLPGVLMFVLELAR